MSDGSIWGPLLLQFCLIIVNAFFALAEIALISINDAKVHVQAEAGNKRAQRLENLTGEPSRFLATIQIGVTLAGALGSAFAAENFSGRLVAYLAGLNVPIPEQTLSALSVVLITLILSYITLVLGELVPKRLGMQFHDKLAYGVSGIISFFAVIFRPVVFLLTKSANGVLRLLGIDPKESPDEVSEEEIRMMVNLGEEKGAIESDERKMIDNVFEFGDKTAEDLMTHRTDMVVLWLEQKTEEIEAEIVLSGHSRFPVCGEDTDDVVGILHVRDFYRNLRAERPKALRDILRAAYFVPNTAQAAQLLRNMQVKKMHLAIVVDEYGGTSGLVTMEDLLEEIVGSIEDEYDRDEKEYEVIGENIWRMRGTMELERAEEILGVELPNEEYDTLGGLVLSQLSAIPDEGSHIQMELCGLSVAIEQINERRIKWLRVEKRGKKDARTDAAAPRKEGL